MRYLGLALGCMMLWCAVAPGQQGRDPAPAPALDPMRSRLDDLLLQWEQKMQKVDTLYAELTRTKEDKIFRTKDEYSGYAKYMKPNLALMHLDKDDRSKMEHYVCSGTFVYEYSKETKEVRFHDIPKNKAGQVADDNLMSFLFGMKADEAKKRYGLKLVSEDKFYYYVEIVPRFDQDKADFQVARLVLNQSTYLPRQLKFRDFNGNVITWDIPRIELGARLDRNEFIQPTVPNGWKLIKAPSKPAGTTQDPNNLPPAVYRSKQ